jgi:hypothetical protein
VHPRSLHPGEILNVSQILFLTTIANASLDNDSTQSSNIASPSRRIAGKYVAIGKHHQP